MPVQKKSSPVAKKTVKVAAKPKAAAKKTTATKKPAAKKPVKRVVKAKPLLTKVNESSFKKFVIEQETYHPEDSFTDESFAQEFSQPENSDYYEENNFSEKYPADQEDEEGEGVEDEYQDEDEYEEPPVIEKPYNRDDYDFQRKFYHSLANEVREKNEEAPVGHHQKRSISFYRKFAIRFTIAVLVLIAIVAFFSFSKLTVSVVPNEELVNENLIISIADENASSTAEVGNTIKGVVRSLIIEDEKIYDASGEEATSESFSGKVFIINKNTVAQTLVVKTRLLTSDNKLFRIKKSVSIPAGGEVEVEVYPDQPSSDMAILPTTFTIPGLNQALQAKIYAESREAFSIGTNTIKYITAEDLANAKKDLSLSLMEKAKVEATSKFPQYDKIIYNVDIAKIVTATDAKEKDKKDEFKMKARGSVQVIAFSQAEAMKLIEGKLKVSVPEGQVLSGLNESSVSYSLENNDEATKVASVRAVFSGRTTFAEGVEIIDRNKLVNLSRDQINDYLKTVEGISAYKLEFSPSFISKAPSLSDRIKVEIVNPEASTTETAE